MIAPPLVDSHVHLDRYPDDTVAAMLQRAARAGVGRLLTVGVDLPASRAALDLASRWPAGDGPVGRPIGDAVRPVVLAAVGIHPTRLAVLGASGDPIDRLRRLLAPEAEAGVPGDRAALPHRPAAIGEVGLDDAAADPDGQRRFLDRCLGLAVERNRPVVLHVAGRVTGLPTAIQQPASR